MNANEQMENLKEIPNIEGNNCFFCGTENPHGLYMKFLTDEERGYSTVLIPEHFSGWKNVAHGGFVTAILDEIMCWTASYIIKKVILTKSITVDFLKPVLTGDTIRAVGEVLENPGGKECSMRGFIYNSKGELCAKGTAKLALYSLNECEIPGFLDRDSVKQAGDVLFNGK